MRLACAGDVGIDEYTNLGVRKPGGIAFNVGFNAIACGAVVSILSAIGDDADGDALSAVLGELPFDRTHLNVAAGATARQSIYLDPNGERRFTGYRAGVLAYW